MQFKLEDKGDVCVLSQKTCSSSAVFTIPTPKATLVDAILAILNDPEQKETIIAEQAVMIEKQMLAGIVIHVGNGRFNIPWPYVFPLVVA